MDAFPPPSKPDLPLPRRQNNRSTMPVVKPLESRPTHKPGAISVRPTPTVHGVGVKRE